MLKVGITREKGACAAEAVDGFLTGVVVAVAGGDSDGDEEVHQGEALGED
jgi:hypothetical protein